MKVIAIYPGRYQPWHLGHKSVYDALVRQFGVDNVYIATSDKVDPPRSPFNFAEKQQIIAATGIDPSRVVQTRDPYKALEITSNYDPQDTKLLFAVSAKDMAEDPRFKSWTKRDGSPAYFQPAPDKVSEMEDFDKHGYIFVVPTLDFRVDGKPMRSATEFRREFAAADAATKASMTQGILGTNDPRLVNLLSSKITEGRKMKLNDVVNETSVGAIGSVVAPLGAVRRRVKEVIAPVTSAGADRASTPKPPNPTAMSTLAQGAKTAGGSTASNTMLSTALSKLSAGAKGPALSQQEREAVSGVAKGIADADSTEAARLKALIKPVAEADVGEDKLVKKPADKKPTPADVLDHARRAREYTGQKPVKEAAVEEGGPFSYGKPPRKGSIAANAAQKRKEQDRKTPAIEPKNQHVGVAKVIKDVKEGRLNEFAPDGFGGDDDGEGFDPYYAQMAEEDGLVKGVSLVDGATLEQAMKIQYWHSRHGGMYKHYFARGFKKGRLDKIRHNNKQYNLNLKLNKDGSVSHGEQDMAEGSEQSLQKKIQAKRDALGLAREQRRMRGQHQQGPREIKLQAEIDRLSTELHRQKQGVSEGHADQQRKIFKKNGQPVGEVGIDRESSPGVGQWYMKCYAYDIDNSGYDSYEEAVAELKHCLKQGVAEGFPYDVDHMPGPVIRNADMTTDNVKTKDKAEWDRATDSINARVFDDMSEFRTDSKGETVVGDSAVWAKWDNATQTGWFNAKGRPLKPWPVKEQGVAEAWSQKYKNSINCSHPRGFSQKAHCAGKRKHNESIEMEMTCPDCGMCESHGSLTEIKKGQKDSNGYTKCWPGKHAEGTKKGKNGGQVRNCVPNEGITEANGPLGVQSPKDIERIKKNQERETKNYVPGQLKRSDDKAKARYNRDSTLSYFSKFDEQDVKEATNDYFKRRKDEEDRIAGVKPSAKRTPQQTDYQKRRAQEKAVGESAGKVCPQCGMTNCSCPPGKCKCKPLPGFPKEPVQEAKQKPSAQERFNNRLKTKHGIDLEAMERQWAERTKKIEAEIEALRKQEQKVSEGYYRG